MEFYKFHAQGNDFIIIQKENFQEYLSLKKISPEDLVRAICRIHHGVGADGLIIVEKNILEQESNFCMTLWNADGGRAEMSGNGIRCLAAYLYFTKIWDERSIRIETDSGIKNIELNSRTENKFWFEVEIGFPRLDPNHIPVNIDGNYVAPLLNIPIEIGKRKIFATLTSMGNPHCSIFVDSLSLKDLKDLGPKIETHSLFPNHTNVEFVFVENRERLKVLFWERGVGRTLSSGTGSCAAAVASILHGFTEREVTVESEAGELFISWFENQPVKLIGPAVCVYNGIWF